MTDRIQSNPETSQQQDHSAPSPHPISRRKVLAALGATGIAAASTVLWNGNDPTSVFAATDDTYGKTHWKDLLYLGLMHYCIAVTVAELRALTEPDAAFAYYVTNPGQEGFFQYDPADTGTPDNTGTVLVSTNGKRFKRHVTDCIVASWFGTKSDGVTADTAALQAALQASQGKTLYIPKQTGPYYLTGQLFVSSHTTIVLESGTIIQAIDTLSRVAPYERLLRIKMVENVRIQGNGATLRMNKTAFTSGEQAHCIDISGSRNVVIEQLNCNDSGGDGFYIGNYEVVSGVGPCKNIVLRDCSADNNRRQGLSVISVEDLLVDHCRFTNTKGTAPEAGVDIEPNGQSEYLRNIRFINCVSENNAGDGFITCLMKTTSKTPIIDITFQSCRTKGNRYGYEINLGGEGVNAERGEVRYIDCIAEEANASGFWDISNSAESVRRSYIRCRAINCNTTMQPDSIYGFSSSFVITCADSQVRTVVGNAEYIDCQSIDNRQTPLIKHGFALKKRTAQKIANVRYFNCTTIGGNQNTYLIDSVAEHISAVNQPQLIYPVAASMTIPYDRIGSKMTNKTATAPAVLTLPVPKPAMAFTFVVDAAHRLALQARSPGDILTPDGAKSVIACAVPGSSITLMGRDDNKWEIASIVGDWLTDSQV
ncbi:right-handed parallel beta-helix repeat-containing protein [Paenibacillus ginsengarvi]|uniref:Right-handed parallel beta-helix repeat-containing protein n=1 Tax=Paenibacillus ginsengarvi TaxID=400777 RepID=A0A3B0CIA8_9BACL|nr:right-handed parallel beta-helix repeat-containing protein [Paenibacillus ginsengarvi]RKN84304.1 right-handed parallel beta-helix repeat-containing protein [Paenibacillus ginsengarvi]